MSLGSLVSQAIKRAEEDAIKVKNAILKAVSEVDNVVLPEVDKFEPLVAQVASAIAPGSGALINVAYAWLEAGAKLLDAGGAAVEQNLTNAGLDAQLIQQVKGIIPQLKAAGASAPVVTSASK